MTNTNIEPSDDFIHRIISEDVKSGKNDGRVHTRFPPEPNGYLHIGHAKSICLNFGLAKEYPGGKCNLRFDDTNPVKEDIEYMEAIKEDIRWLGFDWEDRLYHASDYFEQLYEWAELLIKNGKAYVCGLTPEQVSEYRGKWNEPGKECPFRNRPIEENLDLFRRMRAGEFPDGSLTLRAKIDMSSGNMNMRDPIMYRILHATHPHTGDKWCIYATYDWAHGQSDAIEGITHSLCSLEFEDHRQLYDWFLAQLPIPNPPRQIEFARLNVTHTIMSKRRLLRLVQEGHVSGWDDPRMPTLSGLRRRGYTPESIRDFSRRIGMAKKENIVDIEYLEHCLREHLNKTAPRVMGVLHPLRIVITNYPEARVEELDAINNPEDVSMGTRKIPFSRVLYIERDDFMEEPPKKFFRLAPGREVRLRHCYIIKCNDVVKDKDGNVAELHCTYDPDSFASSPDEKRVKATIHWVSVEHAIEAEVRLYDHLFKTADTSAMEEGRDFIDYLNPKSLEILKPSYVEPGLKDAKPGYKCQFERIGYFCVDPGSSKGTLVFNRSVTLKDEWAKILKQDANPLKI